MHQSDHSYKLVHHDVENTGWFEAGEVGDNVTHIDNVTHTDNVTHIIALVIRLAFPVSS